MFSDQYFYESKVFLKSYKDAQDCLRQSAEHNQGLLTYENQMKNLIEAKKNSEIDILGQQVTKGGNFKESKQSKLYQYSNYIFKTFITGFDSFSGDYQEFKKLLNEGHDKLNKDFSV